MTGNGGNHCEGDALVAGGNGGNHCLDRTVKETHWLEVFLLPLPLTWTSNRVSGDQKLFLDEKYTQK